MFLVQGTMLAELLSRIEVLKFRELEHGHAARGTCVCPSCMTTQKFAACTDVMGIWVYCDNCGMIDY
jgi:hypothetical protein